MHGLLLLASVVVGTIIRLLHIGVGIEESCGLVLGFSVIGAHESVDSEHIGRRVVAVTAVGVGCWSYIEASSASRLYLSYGI